MKPIVWAAVAFVLHGLMVIFFYSNYGPVVGQNTDAGAMGWAPMYFVDFPLMWILEEWVSSNSLFMIALFLLGGLQWGVIAILGVRLITYVFDSH